MLDTIIYKYNDSAPVIINAFENFTGKSYYPDHSFLNVLAGIEPVNSAILHLLSSFLAPALLMWILATFYAVLLFIATYFLFKFLGKSVYGAIVFSAIYLMHPGFIYRIISFTPNLYQVFIYPLILLLLIKKQKPVIIGLIIGLTFSLSSYTAFFASLLIVFWYLSDLVLRLRSYKLAIKNILGFLVAASGLVLLFNFNVVISNLPFGGNYTKERHSSTVSPVVYRDINDYYSFSFRPWYFVIPPKESLLLARISQALHRTVIDTNYYLAFNYSEEEMAGSFMGWHLLLGLGVAIVLLVVQPNRGLQYELVLRLVFVFFALIALSGPPSFTIAGFTIYTPSYLLYQFVPFFRVLTRLSSVLFLLVLSINMLLFTYLPAKRYVHTFLYSLVFVISVISFSIKVPLLAISDPPAEIQVVKELQCQRVAVLPYGDYYSSFWILSHEKELLNPKDFITPSVFDYRDFVDSIVETKQLDSKYKAAGVCIIYYPDMVSKDWLARLTLIDERIASVADFSHLLEQLPGLEVVESNETSGNMHHRYIIYEAVSK